LDDVLATLGQSSGRDAIAIVDACFSGLGDRSVLPPGTRALTRTREATAGGQVLLLSASAASETSGPSSEEAVGVFTKFVAEGLGRGAADIDGDGQITAQELMDWATPRVTRDAAAQKRKQRPQLSAGPGISPASVVLGSGY
jgi:hypothetical protein